MCRYMYLMKPHRHLPTTFLESYFKRGRERKGGKKHLALSLLCSLLPCSQIFYTLNYDVVLFSFRHCKCSYSSPKPSTVRMGKVTGKFQLSLIDSVLCQHSLVHALRPCYTRGNFSATCFAMLVGCWCLGCYTTTRSQQLAIFLAGEG